MISFLCIYLSCNKSLLSLEVLLVSIYLGSSDSIRLLIVCIRNLDIIVLEAHIGPVMDSKNGTKSSNSFQKYTVKYMATNGNQLAANGNKLNKKYKLNLKVT